MKRAIQKTIGAVRNHLPAIAVGASVGAVVVYLYYHVAGDVLVFPSEAAKKLVEQGGAFSYEAYGEKFYLIHHVN